MDLLRRLRSIRNATRASTASMLLTSLYSSGRRRRRRPSPSSRSGCGRCCRSRSPALCELISALEDPLARACCRLGVRPRPVRRSGSTGSRPPSPIQAACRPGSAGSRSSCSRSTSRSIRRSRRASLGGSGATTALLMCSCLPAPGRSPNGCAERCSPAFRGTRSAWSLADTPLLSRAPLIGTYGLSVLSFCSAARSGSTIDQQVAAARSSSSASTDPSVAAARPRRCPATR